MHHESHHIHHDHRAHAHAAVHTIATAFYLNLGFVALEVIGGLLTGSVAILANAIHDLGDCLSLALAWALQKFSTKTRDRHFSYGYGRLSLLSAVISGVVISIGSLVILFTAVPRFWSPIAPHGLGMLVIAIFGVAINAYVAHRLTYGHSVSEKVLLWHFIEDVLGWVAVLVGSIFIYWKNWYWADPFLAIAISAFIIWNVLKNLRKTAKLFLQSVPEDFNQEYFLAEIKNIPGVSNVHDLHIWSMDGMQHILSLHVSLKSANIDELKLKHEIRTIARKMGDYHTTIEIEKPDEGCSDTC